MSETEIDPITSTDHLDTRPLFEARMAAVALDADAAAARVIPRPTHQRNIIDLRFDGFNWCIEDATLDNALQFAHLADAQARANELAKTTGHTVFVHGQDGELLA